jgi:hypothetical protein
MSEKKLTKEMVELLRKYFLNKSVEAELKPVVEFIMND